MVAVAIEKKGIPIPSWDEVYDLVFEHNGIYVKRFSEDECFYLSALLRGEDLAQEGIVDHNARLLTLALDKNQYVLYVDMGDGDWLRLQNIVFIKGKVALVNAHSGLYVPTAKQVKIINSNGREYTVMANQCSVKAFRTKRCDDIGMIVFPRQVPDHIDISKHFIHADGLPRVTSTPATLLLHSVVGMKVTATRYVVHAKMETNKSYYTTKSASKTFCLAQCFTYNAQTVGGDCGSLLVATNPAVPNKILGFHCWGMPDGRGGAFVLTYEELNQILESLPKVAQCELPILGKFDKEWLSETTYIGTGTIQAAPRALKTKLRRSKMDHFEPRTAPAALARVNGVDPLYKAAVKYSNTLPCMNSQHLAVAVADVKSVLLSGHMRDEYAGKGKLSMMESLRGIPEMPFMDSINRTTSPGYPYVLDKRSKRGKQDWIDDDFIPTTDLIKDVEERISLAEQRLS